jgi:NADH-quinone oxidoreductase subunit I
MKESDIIYVDQPHLKFWERIYLPAVLKGLWLTLRHLFRRKRCMQYPEQRREDLKVTEGGLRNSTYRGLHRLNKDDQGRVACVACFMCQTACPANCIHIVGAEAPWPDREKYPVSFWIDELRCIYCGMCEYACPVDAIELTPIYNHISESRRDMIYDKEKLLEVYDKTKDLKPRRNPPIVGYSCTYRREAIKHRKQIEEKENKIE